MPSLVLFPPPPIWGGEGGGSFRLNPCGRFVFYQKRGVPAQKANAPPFVASGPPTAPGARGNGANFCLPGIPGHLPGCELPQLPQLPGSSAGMDKSGVRKVFGKVLQVVSFLVVGSV